jgi:hypothetical protein
MKDLKTRQKQREHFAAVNAGKIDDPVVTHGTDETGNVIGDNGKPVPGTAPGGENTNANPTGENNGGAGQGAGAADYSKLTSHADLDAALEGRTKPEGWDNRDLFKVADKQKWLAEHPAEGSNQGAGQTGNGGWGNSGQ